MAGHQCKIISQEKVITRHLFSQSPDLVLLDCVTPDAAFSLLTDRPNKSTPFIMLCASSHLSDRLHAFALGVEDYLVKPFDILEVVARVHAILRRTKQSHSIYVLDQVMVDFNSHQVFVSGMPVELTVQEFLLLKTFIVNRNMTLPRKKLMELAWGLPATERTRTVDVHIQRLRKKLGLASSIKTVYKRGYRLEVAP